MNPTRYVDLLISPLNDSASLNFNHKSKTLIFTLQCLRASLYSFFLMHSRAFFNAVFVSFVDEPVAVAILKYSRTHSSAVIRLLNVTEHEISSGDQRPKTGSQNQASRWRGLSFITRAKIPSREETCREKRPRKFSALPFASPR